jgi:hypothetical protein
VPVFFTNSKPAGFIGLPTGFLNRGNRPVAVWLTLLVAM